MLIQTKNIQKHYDKVHVLKGINMEVQKSEVISIVGASGAGKTTLLQILGTLEKPDSGSVIMDGTDLARLNSSRLAAFRNKNIGFIFQFHHLLPEFTALENVCIPGMIAHRNRKEVATQAMDLLKYLKIDQRASHKPSALSGGEQQRVAVARALINNPSVILADEPSGNLDSANAKELHALFFSLRKEFGQTFIIVTHNEELAAMADRKLHMKDGLIEE
ncbi:MAG: ABC transporter ATP-binding protein [Bacteroidota bacterium]|nr:ABC transporter ATP-binding protein [Bacteroidota bacterium]